MPIIDRLKTYLSYKKISSMKFEQLCGLSNGASGKFSVNTRASTYRRISESFPDLNVEWLKTGEGDMLNPSDSSTSAVDSYASSSTADLLAIIRSQQETIRTLSETIRSLANGTR